MKYFVALGFFFPFFLVSCSEVNDCHCTIKGAAGRLHQSIMITKVIVWNWKMKWRSLVFRCKKV